MGSAWVRPSSFRPVGVASLVIALVGCDSGTVNGPAEPGIGNTSAIATPQFSDLQDTVTVGPLRVEIRLLRDTLVAREVEVEDEGDRDEEIEGRVVALEDAALVLAPGNIRVRFDGTTRFRFKDDGGEVGADAFVARIRQRIDAGERPIIDAERRAGTTPQAPEDPTFVARHIDLEDGDDDRRGTKLEMFVDGDNLIPNDTPPPHGWIRVLGVDIEIRLDGTTRLEIDDDDRDDDGEIEFEASVEAVDLDASTVRLSTGRVIRVVAETRFDHDDDGNGDGEHLRSLDQVAEALSFGLRVKAEGEGEADADDSTVVVADEIEFEIDDDRERDFEGRVAAVDIDARTFTLIDGTLMHVASFTEWDDDGGHFQTLEAVAEAVAGGQRVEADGDAVVLEDARWLVIDVEFEREDD